MLGRNGYFSHTVGLSMPVGNRAKISQTILSTLKEMLANISMLASIQAARPFLGQWMETSVKTLQFIPYIN